jgi:hypothetical protein
VSRYATFHVVCSECSDEIYAYDPDDAVKVAREQGWTAQEEGDLCPRCTRLKRRILGETPIVPLMSTQEPQ